MSRADCIRKTKRDGDWVQEGHDYEAMVAAYDRDTDRTYIFDQCLNCNKRQVSWCSGKDETALRDYPQFVLLGDPE